MPLPAPTRAQVTVQHLMDMLGAGDTICNKRNWWGGVGWGGQLHVRVGHARSFVLCALVGLWVRG